MIAFDVGGIWFQYRVGGVCIAGGDVLLHRAANEDFWSLPGGRCEAGEAAAETVRREMLEEIGANITVGPLLYVVDNHFTHGGVRCHELGLCFACGLPPSHPFCDRSREHLGIEKARGEALQLIFRWFPLTSLADVPLYPPCLRDAFAEPTVGTRYLVQPDTAANRVEHDAMGGHTEGATR